MSKNGYRYGAYASVILIVASLLLFSWLTVEVTFPTLDYAIDNLPRRLIPADPYNEIATGVSRFLWDYRALDLFGQAFVIVAAVICCLALLKSEEGEF